MLRTAFVWMLNCNLQSSIIIIYIMLFRLVVRKAQRKWCVWLWLPVVYRLICTWTPSFLRWHYSPLPRADSFQTAVTNAGVILYGAFNYTVHGDALTRIDFPISDGLNARLFTIISIIWLVGVIAFAAKGYIDYRRLKARLTGAVRIEDGAYPVYQCASISASFSMGIIHRRVYIPEGMEEQARNMAIAHEHTHLERRDPLWKLIAYTLKCVHWMNPLVHAAYRLWGIDMEHSCDERVVLWTGSEAKTDYCKTLTDMSIGQRPISCPVAFSEGGDKGRIKYLTKPRRLRALWIILAVVIMLNVYRIGLTSGFGIERAKLKMDPQIRARLEYTLDILSDDPENANASGYFEFTQDPDAIKLPGIISDDQVPYSFFIALGEQNTVGWYLSTDEVGDGCKGALIVRLFSTEVPADKRSIDPRKDTGWVVYLEDMSRSSTDDVYFWQYHYQTEEAEVFVAFSSPGGVEPIPVITVLNKMMDRVDTGINTGGV